MLQRIYNTMTKPILMLSPLTSIGALLTCTIIFSYFISPCYLFLSLNSVGVRPVIFLKSLAK